jgi:hypothetical protein
LSMSSSVSQCASMTKAFLWIWSASEGSVGSVAAVVVAFVVAFVVCLVVSAGCAVSVVAAAVVSWVMAAVVVEDVVDSDVSRLDVIDDEDVDESVVGSD